MTKYFMFLLIIVAFSANAQNFSRKGVIEVGGSIGFSSATGVSDGETSDDPLTSFTFQPYFGYFVIKSLELGLIPSFTSLSQGDASNTSFAIYFAPAWNFDLQSKAFPFLEGRIGYRSFDFGGDDDTFSGLSWALRGGLKYQLGKSALLLASLGYTQSTLDHEDWEGDRNGTNVFDVMFGFTVFFGR